MHVACRRCFHSQALATTRASQQQVREGAALLENQAKCFHTLTTVGHLNLSRCAGQHPDRCNQKVRGRTLAFLRLGPHCQSAHRVVFHLPPLGYSSCRCPYTTLPAPANTVLLVNNDEQSALRGQQACRDVGFSPQNAQHMRGNRPEIDRG